MRKSSSDTSIPRSTRIVVIIQISLVFWLAISACVKPFMTDYWANETVEHLLRVVMGDATLLERIEDPPQTLIDRLERNRQRFEAMDEKQRRLLLDDYRAREAEPGKTMSQVGGIVLRILLRDLSPFLQAWMLFSFVVCILLLLRIEGSPQASVVLLVLVALYAWQNWQHGLEPEDAPDTHLIPTEELLVEQYLKAPLEGAPSEEQEQLRRGWHLYLVDHYLGEEPGSEEAFSEQVERAEWLFLLERLDLWRAYTPPSVKEQLRVRHSALFLIFALLWHVFFVYWVTRKNAIVPEYFQDIS